MAIDNTRLETFREYVDKLQKDLSFTEFRAVMEAKLFDFASKNPDVLELAEVKREIGKFIKPVFKEYFDLVFANYDNVIYTINDLYSDLGLDVGRDMTRIKAIERVNKTDIGRYSQSSLNRIAKTVRESLAAQKTEKELIKDLSRISSKVQTYSEALAKTQMKGYARTVKAEKSMLGDVEWFEYVGWIRPKTRTFCLKCLGEKMFKLSTILNDLDNGPSQPKPVITYAGGWRCAHDFEPDPFYSPKKKNFYIRISG